jgi:exodeoxyribonuclease V alpha subunit
MPETVTLTVSSLTFTAVNGAAIFSGQCSTGLRVRVIAGKSALPRQPAVGEVWEVTGEYRDHPKYGRQLHAKRGCHFIPQGRLLINYLTQHPDFVGIGEGKAKVLYETFGEQLVSILDNSDIEALCTVLSSSMAERLVTVWADKRAEAAVVEYLDQRGFDIRLANKLQRVWGANVIKVLELNPYYMLAFATWNQTDNSARKLGVHCDDERRLVGAVEAALYARLQNAHTLTPSTLLRKQVAKLLGASQVSVERGVELALLEGAVVGNDVAGYQAIGAAALEARIAERIQSMLAGELATQFSLFNSECSSAWLAATIAENEEAQGFSLNAQQHDAVLMATTKPFSMLTGGAGVGKTTVLRIVINIAKRLNLKVIQMALAGRAAKRMTEATGHESMTIAKFLHQAKEGQLEVSSDTLVIVDEASMLDLPTAFRILKYLPDGVRLLLVGDPAQLPPIGFGLVFHRLVLSSAVPKVELIEVHRQAAETGIPSFAAAIREHRVPLLRAYAGRRPGVSFIECDPNLMQGKLKMLAADWSGEDAQILGAIKDGPAGISAINQNFHDECDGECLIGFHFRVGEPVIHLINDYDRGLMNGTLGRIIGVKNADTLGLLIDFEGTEHFISVAEITNRLELAYAISVHKAQGSQFRRVAVVITQSRILDHALIYTALTRGIEQVVFIGNQQTFQHAVQSPALAHLREVGLTI